MDERFLNYSQLLSTIVDDTGKGLNDTTVAFLYQLFPDDMFVKAFSLLESNNIFLYLWNSDVTVRKPSSDSDSTEADDSRTIPADISSHEEKTTNIDSMHTSGYSKNDPQDNTHEMLKLLYAEENRSVMHRIIVQSIDKGNTQEPIYVNVSSWLCSCNEYSECLLSLLRASDNIENTNTKDDQPFPTAFEVYAKDTEDKFAKVSTNKHVNINKVFCEHLLASSILLHTSLKVLNYFTTFQKTVSVFTIANRDDWLRLHLNIVE